MSPEMIAGLATLAGVLLRHFVPALKRVLPARPGDPQPTTPTPPSAPVVTPAAEELTAALEWALRAQVARTSLGAKLSDADSATVKSLDTVLHVLMETK